MIVLNYIPSNYLTWLSGWEGGLVNDPIDKGGLTNRGWSKPTFINVMEYGLKHNTISDKYTLLNFNTINDDLYKELHNTYLYMNALHTIKNKKLMLLIYEYILGGITAYYRVSKLLQNYTHEVVTLLPSLKNSQIINSLTTKQADLFYNDLLADKYIQFKEIVVKNPAQSKFLQGWLNRLNSFKSLPISQPIGIGIIAIIGTLLIFTIKSNG